MLQQRVCATDANVCKPKEGGTLQPHTENCSLSRCIRKYCAPLPCVAPFVTCSSSTNLFDRYLSYKFDNLTFRCILMSFRKRRNSSTLPCPSVLDDANSFMTKNGVTVTVIFILTMGYIIIYYMLGMIGVASYVVNSPAQKAGLLLSAFNSVANPFVYILLMPAFRSSLRKTFHVPRLRCITHCNINTSTEDFGSAARTTGTAQAMEHASSRATLEETTVCSNDVHLEMTHVDHST